MTTLKPRLPTKKKLDDGFEYTLSYRSKWINGNNQLNSRLWFNRLSNTYAMPTSAGNGTPGQQNPTLRNTGPTYDNFLHHPTTPLENQSVTVQTRIDDPDGVASSQLWWRQDGQEWNSVDMTVNESGLYVASIPAHSSGTIVQFYVEAIDGQGVVSTFPADGADSRALYQVEDGNGSNTGVDNWRIVVMEAEEDRFFLQTNRMSNWFLPMTLVHNGTPYYDVSMRQIGSRWIRPNSGYKIRLNPEQLAYGIHDSVRFDMNGLAEVVMKQMLNRAGGHQASNYDDLGFLISPNRSHTHHVIVQLARYETVYLNEQFEDGNSGTKWELDDVTVATSPIGGDEGLKRDTAVYEQGDIGISGAVVARQGDDPEFYRAHLLIKSNREKDDFRSIAELAQAIHKTGDELFEATNEVMDVDLWMRHYANQAYFGNWDTYGFRRPKNLRIYERPTDGKIIPLFWDCDLCNFNERLKTPRENTSRLDEIRDIPHNLRLFWGHLYDYVNRSFNEEYVSRWAAHYGALVGNNTHGGDETFTGIANSTRVRSAQVMEDMQEDIPRVDFAITTNGGNDITVETPTIDLEGKGWVDVRVMRIAGTDQELDVAWPEADSWQFEFPLSGGTESITVEAVGWNGQVIATDTINVTSTTADPVAEALRISEIQYSPADPSATEILAGFDNADDFAYIEVENTGIQTLDLSGVAFTRDANDDGVTFGFAEGTVLEPGASIVVAEDVDAFQNRYGNDAAVAGQWSGGLRRQGEVLTLTTNSIVIHQFAYDNSWHPNTDGTGRSLQIVDAQNPDLASWAAATSWLPSSAKLGSPGSTEPSPGDINGDGLFNSTDLLSALQAGGYEDGIAGNADFGSGDFNGDGDFTTADLVFAFTYNVYTSEDAAVAAHPIELQQASSTLHADRADQVSTVATRSNRFDELRRRRGSYGRLVDAAVAVWDIGEQTSTTTDDLAEFRFHHKGRRLRK